MNQQQHIKSVALALVVMQVMVVEVVITVHHQEQTQLQAHTVPVVVVVMVQEVLVHQVELVVEHPRTVQVVHQVDPQVETVHLVPQVVLMQMGQGRRLQEERTVEAAVVCNRQLGQVTNLLWEADKVLSESYGRGLPVNSQILTYLQICNLSHQLSDEH
jgi:hypothetical protein